MCALQQSIKCFAEYLNQDRFHLPTKATLVIAPSHLTEQWSDEIAKHTDFKPIVIVSKPRWDTVRLCCLIPFRFSDCALVFSYLVLSSSRFRTWTSCWRMSSSSQCSSFSPTTRTRQCHVTTPRRSHLSTCCAAKVCD